MAMTISLYSELRREWLLWKAYRVNAISSLVMWGVIFPVLLVTVQSVAINSGVYFGPEEQAQSLIGFIVWKLCMGVLVAVPAMIEEEMRTGTLENVLLSTRMPFRALFFCRILARSLRSLLETVLLTLVLMLVFRLPLGFSPAAYLVTGLTLAGVWGVGYGVAGLALLYKSVGSVTGLLASLSFLISGALVPLDSLGVLYTALKLLFPMTWGIEILREVVLNDTPLVELMQMDELPGLALQTAALLLIGLFIFQRALQRARQRGELGVY
jgi:ABC-2 type transport system permease protein